MRSRLNENTVEALKFIRWGMSAELISNQKCNAVSTTAGIMSYHVSSDFYVLWIGPRGSGRVQELVNFSGSGRVTPFLGRVGSQNLDPRATLIYLWVIFWFFFWRHF